MKAANLLCRPPRGEGKAATEIPTPAAHASGSVKFNYRQFLTYHNCINKSLRERKTEHGAQARTGADLPTEMHTCDTGGTEDLTHTHTHTCVCATGLVPLFSCERKKRMDMKSSWMQTRNSSSFWPPVASEKSRRDWIMYLKMYSLACRTERTIILYHLSPPSQVSLPVKMVKG